ncbi:cytochrome P450 [Phanerochaete sordida]|uniref:Cytochrome P450 n=1 Tax=Phanerochaete sordida TaxID=48140 RepID=A0A9P3FZD6_9APHY|nr:cytochrome P450 [Phanerochaete sordida]
MATPSASLTATERILAVAACGLVAHWIFNRREPSDFRVLFALLFVAPAVASQLLFPLYGIFSGFLLSFFVYHTTLLASIIIYRLSPLHPLARYPGPLLAKITRWYWTLVALRGRQHVETQRLFELYGDAIRVGPNEVWFRDPAVLQPMLGSQGMPKSATWQGRSLNAPIQALIGIRDNASHARRRRPWTRAFSSAALRNYEPVIARRGAQFVELLAEKKRVDFGHWVHLFAFDFMSDALFGGGSESMQDDDADGVVSASKEAFSDAQLYENLPWVGFLVRYLPAVGKKTKLFRASCLRRGLERLRKGSSTKDLFYWLNNEDESEKENPPKPVVIVETGLAIIAGSDTTSVTLTNLVYCILAHPHVYERLQEEIDRFYPPEQDAFDSQYLSQMRYLDAVINETMRVYPVLANGTQRGPEPGTGGFVAGEHFIPEWTSVRVPQWSMHRDARNFTLPLAYTPERWLLAANLPAPPSVLDSVIATGGLVHNTGAYTPFSYGSRNCVGRNLALLEMKLVVTHMLQRVRLRFAEGFDPSTWEARIQERFNLVLPELPIVVERRV